MLGRAQVFSLFSAYKWLVSFPTSIVIMYNQLRFRDWAGHYTLCSIYNVHHKLSVVFTSTLHSPIEDNVCVLVLQVLTHGLS
jgi:hypothetical protein